MDAAKIANTIINFLQTEFPNDDVQLSVDTDLIDEWLGDSLSIVEIVLFLESEFGIEVSRADINGDTFSTVGALSTFVAQRM